jgi:single-strand DNA-binding protein
LAYQSQNKWHEEIENMRDVNKVILLGRLGKDPIGRNTRTGTTVVTFSVATKNRFSKASQVTGVGTLTPPAIVEETQWHKVVSWGKLAEACSQFLKKGNSVYVEGSLHLRQYEDKNKVTRTSAEIHAETISFLGGHSYSRQHPVIETPPLVSS